MNYYIMDKISDRINKLYKKLFLLEEHPFYQDLDNVKKINKLIESNRNKEIKSKIKFNPSIQIPKEVIFKENKLKKLNYETLRKLSFEMNKSNNLNNIINLVNQLYFMEIPSNVKDMNLLEKKFNESKKINIAIIGAGPLGLFLASYLHKYYNFSYGLNNQPNVNIIVFDNRITKKGFKKPYTRTRPFAFGSSFFSYIIPNIYSWEGSKDYLILGIYILEYVLFCQAYFNFDIPFIFDNYNWTEYKNILNKLNISVVFDCTGGKLNPQIFDKDLIKTDWLDKFIRKEKFPKLVINKEENLVKLDINKENLIKDYYYGTISIINKNKIIIDKIDVNITNIHDFKLFINLKGKYFDLNSIKTICSLIQEDTDRNYIYNIIKNYKKTNLFNTNIFHANMKHALMVSKVIDFQNNKMLYIGSGDTIFHGHFVTGSGLNRTVSFAVKCANFITSLLD